MAQKLKVLAALAEDLGSVPITTLGRSSPFSDLLQQQQVHGYTYKHIYTPQIKINLKMTTKRQEYLIPVLVLEITRYLPWVEIYR